MHEAPDRRCVCVSAEMEAYYRIASSSAYVNKKLQKHTMTGRLSDHLRFQVEDGALKRGGGLASDQLK